MARHELCSQPSAPRVREHYRCADSKPSVQSVAGGRQVASRVLDIQQQAARAVKQRLAFGGELQGACAAFDQQHAKRFLEVTDVAGQRGLGPVACATGLAEASGTDNAMKIGQRGQIHGRTRYGTVRPKFMAYASALKQRQ